MSKKAAIDALNPIIIDRTEMDKIGVKNIKKAKNNYFIL